MALKLLIRVRRISVEYFPNYLELVACLSTVNRTAKPKHPINIWADSANTVDKAEIKLIEVYKMFFLEESLHSDQGFLITLYVNELKKIYTAKS